MSGGFFITHMALLDIIQKIVSDAEKSAAEMVANAEIEAASIRTSGETEAKEEEYKIEEMGKKKGEQIRKKVENLAAHQKKSAILAEKRAVLIEVFEGAKKEVANLPQQEKERILTSLLSEITEAEGVIHPTKSDVNIIEPAMKKAGKNFKMGELVSGMGGFQFVSPNLEMDFRFNVLLDRELSKKLEGELSILLFPNS